MPSLKDLRNRITSVKSTQKITSAMKMVAAAKLRRAQEQAEAARPYAERMERMLGSVAASVAGMEGAPPLLAGIGQFNVAVRQFEIAAEHLEAVGDAIVIRAQAREGRLAGRVMLHDRQAVGRELRRDDVGHDQVQRGVAIVGQRIAQALLVSCPRDDVCCFAVHGIDSGQHAATLSCGDVGVLHGARSYLLQDDDGQVTLAHSISAGLDYPGVGPQHAFLKDSGRVTYASVTDTQAVIALQRLSRCEGITPALETAHAIAKLYEMADAGELGPDDRIVVCLSGRGDKDVEAIAEHLDAHPEEDLR